MTSTVDTRFPSASTLSRPLRWAALATAVAGGSVFFLQLSPLALAAVVAWGLYRRVRRQPVRPL